MEGMKDEQRMAKKDGKKICAFAVGSVYGVFAAFGRGCSAGGFCCGRRGARRKGQCFRLGDRYAKELAILAGW